IVSTQAASGLAGFFLIALNAWPVHLSNIFYQIMFYSEGCSWIVLIWLIFNKTVTSPTSRGEGA
ncbi:MAG: hypothetical protein U9R69_05600, partial [Thermodesulfobacteriota bacterium]|nr:hypothetical protein [Thermodesulfobacteriota bacterium]